MKKTNQFDKFSKKKSNAAIKEQFRQEKRVLKKEREEYFDKKRASSNAPRYVDKNAPPLTKDQGPQTGARKPSKPDPVAGTDQMPLNKFIAHSGISGRREAAETVKKGLVKVNGQVVVEPGLKVSTADTITVNGKKIFLQRNLVYILLNKPKDYLTTTNDPQQRKTVMDIIRRATRERVYPVGRLDRNTSGVLLMTNDGELAQKLAHPSNEIKKVYSVTLDRPLDKKGFRKNIEWGKSG